MSWVDKKIPLPSFLNSESKSKAQAESRVSDTEEPPILKCAVLKKLKGSHQYKKKFFVLLGATSSTGAKLVYYDSEQKHRAKNPPKREIVLEKCFNINRKQDSQDKFGKRVVALSLYTLDDCVQISFDDREDELNEWLEQLLYLQQGKTVNFYGKKPKPTFENVYQINVKSFRPDDITNTLCPITSGPHRLCVTSSGALLYPLGEERYVELPHPCIRNIRYNDKLKLLGLEIGRTSPSGSGLLSLDCEEKEVISQLHEVLRKAMSSANSKEQLCGSKTIRTRSSSFSQERGSKPRGIPPLGKRERERQEYLSRNRTISEPVCEGGKAGHVTPEPGSGPRCPPVSVRYSPSIMSPTSPVGSVSAGLSDDGTGSSNSINDPAFNGDLEPHIFASEAIRPIPEESSGEVSIEFKKGEEKKPDLTDSGGGTPCCAARGLSRGDYHEEGCASLPRTRLHHVYHKKQPSLPDYMPMNIVPPPLPARNAEQPATTAALSSSLPSGSTGQPRLPPTGHAYHHHLHHHHQAYQHHLQHHHLPYRPAGGGGLMQQQQQQQLAGGVTSPTDNTSSPSGEYHLMTGLGSPVMPLAATPLSSPDSNYLPMDLGSSQPGPSQSSAPKFDSSLSLVVAAGGPDLAAGVVGFDGTPQRPLPVLPTPERGKQRTPSGESGYVIMSPGVSVGEVLSISEEPASLAALEESLGGRWHSSPRHSSPVMRRNRGYVDSQRNSSCLDDTEVLWGEWRLNDDPDTVEEECLDPIGRSPVGPNDDYMLVNYPRPTAGSSTAVSTPRPISGVSPASSTSVMSLGGGTPSSGPRFGDLADRLEKMSYFRDTTDESSHSASTTDDKVTARPPRASTDFRRSVGIPVGGGGGGGGGRFMDVPGSSKSSSRSNVSPFGRTPPSSSPNVASRLEGLFRNRAGSVPNKPPIFDRRRHRTQSEGEKDAGMDT